MTERMYDFCVDLVAMAVVNGFNVVWRDNVITIYLPEEGIPK